MNPIDNTLDTLDDSGVVPVTRISNASQARTIWEALRRADELRARKREQVRGLVDGNPPYRQADLIAAGRDDKTNINFRQAEAYFNNAVGLFYDLFSEAPSYATVKLKVGSDEERSKWSRVVTTHFDWLCRFEPCFDYHTQISQDEMVLFGCGPLIFEDEFDWRPKSILCGQLKVPERTRSDTSLWEVCTIEVEYLPHELYGFILHEKESSSVGWNVERVKQAIIEASPESNRGGLWRNWEWHQQQLKQGSLSYSYTSRTIPIAHIFFREFPKSSTDEGKISHVMILRESKDSKADTFMFQKIGRYDTWNECVHPMYYDRGGGGFHYSVTGMGVKMFSAIAFQNRVLCNLGDKAFTPKVMFKPTTSTTADAFSLQQFGDFAVLSEGFEAVQTPISGVMDEAMIFNRDLTNMIGSNLSQYRSRPLDEQGNPPTATQVTQDASQQAALQKTQMNRYYAQMDGLYTEMYRRAVNGGGSSIGSVRAKEFIKRCEADGVPKKALAEVDFIKASRVVGQGSDFLRQQSTEFLFGNVLPMLPEDGRQHLVQDVIAARAGQSAVSRYYPTKDPSQLPDEQYATAMSQVADMKTGVPAVPTSNQNPMVFAGVFLQAMEQAVQSLQSGAQPAEVASFLDLAGKGVATHLQRMGQDKSRKQVVQQMSKKLKEFAGLHDELAQQIQDNAAQQQQQQQQMAAQQQQMQSEQALAQMKVEGDLRLRQRKTDFAIADKARKTTQSLAINDAKAASGMRMRSMEHAHSARMAEMQAEHDKKMDMMKMEQSNEKD